MSTSGVYAQLKYERHDKFPHARVMSFGVPGTGVALVCDHCGSEERHLDVETDIETFDEVLFERWAQRHSKCRVWLPTSRKHPRFRASASAR